MRRFDPRLREVICSDFYVALGRAIVYINTDLLAGPVSCKADLQKATIKS